MDYFGSLHKSHFEKAEITNPEQFNKDIDICKQVLCVSCELAVA